MGLQRYIRNLFRHDRNMREKLTQLQISVQQIESKLECAGEIARKQYLHEKMMCSKELGITKETISDYEIVVSLTTYGVRIHDVYLAIESIMQGTIKPNRIVLWLSEDEFKGNNLPISLQKQMKRGLEVEYCSDIRSYKKLIPSLKKFPNSCIITIDDDLMYDFDLVEKLVHTHDKHPNCICANRLHRMKLDEYKMPLSYMEWDWGVANIDNSRLSFFTTGGGTLFPPHVFSAEVFNESVFMSDCPFADDVWFNAMRLLSNIHVIKSQTRSLDGDDFINISNVQYMGLYIENTNSMCCRNDIQISTIWKRYEINKLIQ